MLFFLLLLLFERSADGENRSRSAHEVPECTSGGTAACPAPLLFPAVGQQEVWQKRERGLVLLHVCGCIRAGWSSPPPVTRVLSMVKCEVSRCVLVALIPRLAGMHEGAL